MNAPADEIAAKMQRIKEARQLLGIKDDEIPVNNSILIEADDLVNIDRNGQYGPWDRECAKVTFITAMLLEDSLAPWTDAQRFTLQMMVLKLVRQGYKPKRDSLVDLVGYSELLQRLFEART